jgi:hypothetical protein
MGLTYPHRLSAVKHGGPTRQQLADQAEAQARRADDLVKIIESSLWSGPKLIGQVAGEYHGYYSQVWYAAGHLIIAEMDDMKRVFFSSIFKLDRLRETAAFYAETLTGAHYHRIGELLRSEVMDTIAV